MKIKMKKDYSYKENIIWFADKQIILCEKIAEVVEFDKCVVIRKKYTNENPKNNVVAYDFDGNKIWEVDNIIKPLEPQTVVSIGKRDSQYISIVTFTGLNLLIEAQTGRVADKKITK